MQNVSFEKKKGLALFFHLLITQLLNIIFLNILFILTSIPILTIPSSFSSMTKVMQKIVNDDEKIFVLKDFFFSFQKNFLSSTLLGLIIYGSILGFLYGAYFYYLNSSNNTINLFFMALCLIMVFILSSIGMYSFQMIVSVSLKMKPLLKNSIVLIFMYPLKTILTTSITLAIIGTGIWYFPYSIPLLFLIIFSLSCFIRTLTAFPLIKKHIIR